jgi:hypothetical protein
MDATYGNKLREYITNPGSFRSSPGYQYAVDQGQEAINRKMAAGGMRGSGNALAALMKHGQGMAEQDYGNTVDRLGRLSGQEQQYDLGQGQLSLGRDRLGLDRELGQGQLSLGRDRLGLDRELGSGRLDLDRELGMGKLGQDSLDSERNFGLGMFRAGNDYSLGQEQNANTAQRNAWDFDMGMDRNNIARAEGQNNYNLGNRRLDVDWMNANTNRGAARSRSYNEGRQTDLEWMKQTPRSYY